MSLNRRAFIQRFGIGLAGALALANLPKAAVAALDVTEAGEQCARAYLRRRYLEYQAGDFTKHPERIEVSRGLFKAFEGELIENERFVWSYAPPAERNLCFKATRVVIRDDIRRWEDLRIISPLTLERLQQLRDGDWSVRT